MILVPHMHSTMPVTPCGAGTDFMLCRVSILYYSTIESGCNQPSQGLSKLACPPVRSLLAPLPESPFCRLPSISSLTPSGEAMTIHAKHLDIWYDKIQETFKTGNFPLSSQTLSSQRMLICQTLHKASQDHLGDHVGVMAHSMISSLRCVQSICWFVPVLMIHLIFRYGLSPLCNHHAMRQHSHVFAC